MEESDDVPEQIKRRLERARGVFERAESYFRTWASALKEERKMLLEEWLSLERSFGEQLGDVEMVRAKKPQTVKRKRQREDGTAGDEEYYDYIFPDERQTTGFKIMEAAYNYKWKKESRLASNPISKKKKKKMLCL